MSIPTPAGRIRWLIGIAAALLLVLLASVPAAPAGAAERRVQVIVQMDKGGSIPAGTAWVRNAGGKVTGRLAIINGFAAEIPARTAERLAALPGVRAVTRNGKVETRWKAPKKSKKPSKSKRNKRDDEPQPTPDTVNVSELRSAYPASAGAIDAWNRPDGGATGNGIGVAIIDTGIAGAMPDFDVAGRERGSRVVASVVTNPYARTAYDTFGHGTHVAGIVGGNGSERNRDDSLQNRYIGIAPDADLISVKVSDDRGEATILDVIYGLQFVVDHADEYNIRVVNLSLESTVAGSYKTDPLNAAVEAAWFDGIVVVAAAGNRGNAADAVTYAPGNDPFAITVGAVDDNSSMREGDDRRPAWSSHGTTQDGFAKPEIHAPGARIVSTLSAGSQFSRLCPGCIVDREMIRASGTSMSAPMVAGAAALLLDKHPELTPDQVKGLLMASARDLGGYPALDVYGALKLVAAGNVPVVNQSIEPNDLIDPATGDIDYTRSSWSRSSWSHANGLLTADWARSSWSCDCSRDADGSIDPQRSSWSRSSWSTELID